MRFFFKGLNELRGIAAIGVVFSHIELYKYREKIPSLYNKGLTFSFIERIGKNGVYLFFVLSGFLITYLLLSETRYRGTVDITKFYIRRILRIWPLYYLLILTSFFIFPQIVEVFNLEQGSYYSQLVCELPEHFMGRLVLFLLFLPNLALILFSPVAGVSQSWSVGVEEQFYLIWPQILKRCGENILPFLIAVIIFKFALLYSLLFLNGFLKQEWLRISIAFLKAFNIELMALGGIGAYLLMNDLLGKVYSKVNPYLKGSLILVIVVLLFVRISDFLLGIVFLFLILLNIDDKHFLLRNKFLSSLGDVSYGIYMYHPLVMFFTFSLVNRIIPVDNLFVYNLLVYVITIGGSIVISRLSYKYFEAGFLRLKDRFVVIPSGKSVEGKL